MKNKTRDSCISPMVLVHVYNAYIIFILIIEKRKKIRTKRTAFRDWVIVRVVPEPIHPWLEQATTARQGRKSRIDRS